MQKDFDFLWTCCSAVANHETDRSNELVQYNTISNCLISVLFLTPTHCVESFWESACVTFGSSSRIVIPESRRFPSLGLDFQIPVQRTVCQGFL